MASRPFVTKVSPPSGDRVPNVIEIELEFDQPMAPPEQAFPYLVVPKEDFAGARPELVPRVEYNPSTRTFRIPLIMPSKDPLQVNVSGRKFSVPPLFAQNQEVKVTLSGFKSAKGIPAEPVELRYQRSTRKFTAADESKLSTEAKKPELLRLLESMQERRHQIRFVDEKLQQLSMRGGHGVFRDIELATATFMWRPPNFCFADFGELTMWGIFRLGADGTNWWIQFQANNRTNVTIGPMSEVGRWNISFCDPFGLTMVEPGIAAEKRYLKLLGLVKKNGESFHRVEAWSVRTFPGSSTVAAELVDWFIDSRTLRPAEIIKFSPGSVQRIRFVHGLTQPPRLECFSAPGIPGVSPQSHENLRQGCTNRFVVLHDGSDGRVRVGSGMYGPNGSKYIAGGLDVDFE